MCSISFFSHEFLQREVFYKSHCISACGDSWLFHARVWDCASWTLEIQPLPWLISSLHWLLQSVMQENCQVLRLGPKQWGRFSSICSVSHISVYCLSFTEIRAWCCLATYDMHTISVQGTLLMLKQMPGSSGNQKAPYTWRYSYLSVSVTLIS